MSPEKGGALRNQSTGGRRLGVAAIICGALFGAPLLLLHSNAAHASRPEAAAHAGHGAHKNAVYPASHLDTVNLPSHLVAYHAARIDDDHDSAADDDHVAADDDHDIAADHDHDVAPHDDDHDAAGADQQRGR